MFWYCLCFLSLSSTIVFLPFPSVFAFSFCLLHVQPFLPSAFGLLPLSCALTPFFYLLICFVFWYCPAFCLCLQAWFSPLFFRIFFGFNYLNHFLLFLPLAFSYYHMPKHCLLSLPSAFTFCLWLLLLFFAFAFHLYISFSCPFSQYSYHFLLFTYICKYNLFNIFVIFGVQLP